MKRRILRRLTALGLVTAGLIGATPAMAEPVGVAQGAAGWLARQLVDGERMETVFDGVAYPDYGLTADVVFALDAAGVAQDFAAKATNWLAGDVAGYVGDGTAEAYAGPHAKLALVAQAQGLDPTAFGGVDLLARLRALQTASGRLSDKSGTDYSNGISQSLGVLALDRAGDAPGLAADYLAGSACPDGGFPLYLEQATCASDVDTTGFAVQALIAADRGTAATAGLTWLVGKQQAGGGFGGSGPTSAVNANSTGLAAVALRVGGKTEAADKAVAYLKSLQVGCTGAPANQGAIAYDANGFQPGNAPRATAQGVPGLVGVGLAMVSKQGATAADPRLDCVVPTTSTDPTTTQPTSTTTTVTTSTSTAVPATTTTPAPVVQRGDLADTGVAVGPALWLGSLLLLAGSGAVLVSRRRFTKAGKR